MLRTVIWVGEEGTLQTQEIQYELNWKKVKNINLRVKPGGRVVVSAPSRIGVKRVDSFVQSRVPWILEAASRLQNAADASRPYICQYQDGGIFYWQGKRLTLHILRGKSSVLTVEDNLQIHIPPDTPLHSAWKLLRCWMEEQGTALFRDRLRALYPFIASFGISYPVLKTRWMKSRWGSCAFRKGQITLNKALICAPLHCIDYVILHELTHFLHPDHSGSFYKQLAVFCPQHEQIRREMRLMSPESWTPPSDT